MIGHALNQKKVCIRCMEFKQLKNMTGSNGSYICNACFTESDVFKMAEEISRGRLEEND